MPRLGTILQFQTLWEQFIEADTHDSLLAGCAVTASQNMRGCLWGSNWCYCWGKMSAFSLEIFGLFDGVFLYICTHCILRIPFVGIKAGVPWLSFHLWRLSIHVDSSLMCLRAWWEGVSVCQVPACAWHCLRNGAVWDILCRVASCALHGFSVLMNVYAFDEITEANNCSRG